MPFDDPNDREVARKVLEVIRSDKYKAKNYLFLAPFDMSQVPGYLELVGQPIDLATIANKLQSDVYTKETFWHDMDLVFQNAIKYHGGKETKWIAKFAKDMLKNVARERNNLEKGKPTKPVKVKQELKKKIKVKMGTGSSNKSDDKTVKKAKPTQSKPQPKLKLKLSLKKKEEPSPPAVPSAPKSTKIKISTGGSRGKELPQGVVAPPAPKSTAKPPPKPKAATTKKSTSSVGSTKSSTTKTKKKSLLTKKLPKANTKLDAAQTKLCYKVIAGLKRRNHKNIGWFNSPVSDKAILADYRSKIKQPMDLQTITSKLDKGSYKNLECFCLDLRRVFANAMKYNTTIKDSLRPLALQILQSAEKLLQMFIYRLYPESYPPLLYCWKVCVDILSTLYNLVNPSDGQPLAYYFLHPVAVYCGGQFPVDYKEKVSKPMDFGTVTANLLEGRYQSVEAFSSDCRLVIQNCQTYYNGRPEGKVFVDQALRLNDVLSTQLLQLARYDKSKGASGRKKLQDEMLPSNILSRVVLPNQPPTALLLAILQEMRALQYTDKATKITEPAMVPFEKPVNLTVFPDYPQFVREPMDLQTVERKVRQNSIYEMPEDFEYDMNLIWKNSEVYNLRRNDLHSVNMAKYASRQFRRIFYARMQSFEDPTVAAPPPPQRDTSSPPTKKIKIDTSGTSKGKMGPGPKISITASQVMAASRAKSPVQKKAGAPPRPKANQPVPLHIAIARVKEAFPLRRTVKTLQSWEADCARYFKELMRHPWITGQKFIFHVPVPTLFPELRDIYAAKIKQPMDLTTVECQMLAGNRYAGPEDFIQDVALVFENAIKFNKDSKDLGDPLSCAYYDASVHLLRYSRWLSLELLSSHVDNTSDHTDEYRANGLPPSTWKLTGGNRRVARKETEDIIRKEPIEKSIEGDRYTWMEAECEKLLKALRLQSDVRYMTFFIQANYPADYTAFISKPMDWEKVNRTLRKRQYDTIDELIEDLRLIFINAEKYNSRLKAYEAAKHMSAKLELAINKLFLSVSDRLERERIDHANAEREIEAAERKEEEEIRANWKKDTEKEGTVAAPTGRTELLQKSRSSRRIPQRRADFEIPFFDDEDNGQHERSYFEVVKFQKAMFEKQRQDLAKARKTSQSVGTTVLARRVQKTAARKALLANTKAETVPEAMEADKESDNGGDNVDMKPSAVLNELERKDRGPLQMKVALKKPKTANPKVRKNVFG